MEDKLCAIKIEHDSYISLHVQLHNALRQLIVSRRWKYGERIPTETQLVEHLDISRTTIRIALQLAEVEGLIKRNAGRGTFVSYNPETDTTKRLIGYVTQSFDNEIHRVLLSSAENELRAAGFRVIFSNATSGDEEAELLQQLLFDDVEGLLLYPNAKPNQTRFEILKAYQSRNIPVVFVDRPVEGIDVDCVSSDNFGGAYAAVQHLIDLGHQHIVYLKPEIDGLMTIDERYRGYKAALEAHELDVYDAWSVRASDRYEVFETDVFQVYSQDHSHIGKRILQQFQLADPKPTAIFCVNDALAIILIKVLNECDVKIPDDISVVGFDDISLAAYLNVPLTTVAQDSYTIGRTAARLLLDRLEGQVTEPGFHFVPVRLQSRKSTAAPVFESVFCLENKGIR